MFRGVGDCLRYAYQHKYLHLDDFYGTDRTVLEKIGRQLDTDPQLQLLFDRMNNKIPFLSDPSNPKNEVFCKSRVVDPLCIHQGSLLRLSEIDPSWLSCIRKESVPRSVFYWLRRISSKLRQEARNEVDQVQAKKSVVCKQRQGASVANHHIRRCFLTCKLGLMIIGPKRSHVKKSVLSIVLVFFFPYRHIRLLYVRTRECAPRRECMSLPK